METWIEKLIWDEGEKEKEKERETVFVWSTVAPFSIKNLAISKCPFSQTEDNAVLFGARYNQIKIKEERIELNTHQQQSIRKNMIREKKKRWVTEIGWREEPFSKRNWTISRSPNSQARINGSDPS